MQKPDKKPISRNNLEIIFEPYEPLAHFTRTSRQNNIYTYIDVYIYIYMYICIYIYIYIVSWGVECTGVHPTICIYLPPQLETPTRHTASRKRGQEAHAGEEQPLGQMRPGKQQWGPYDQQRERRIPFKRCGIPCVRAAGVPTAEHRRGADTGLVFECTPCVRSRSHTCCMITK